MAVVTNTTLSYHINERKAPANVRGSATEITTLKMRSPMATFFICAGLLATSACSGGSATPPSPTQSSPRQPLATSSCSHTFSAARQSFSVARAGVVGLRPPAAEPEAIVSGNLAVRFTGNQIPPRAASLLASLGAHEISQLNADGAATFSIPQSDDARAAAQTLRAVPGVVSAGPIIARRMLGVLPNDPLFGTATQWDMYAIGMPGAWSITQGSPSVTVAVIDTGYDSFNPDLSTKVDRAIVFDLGTGMPDRQASAEDTDGHGSNVSGIAAADTNNATDVAGTGWNVHLLEARVFKNGSALSNDIAAAIDWAVANHAKVINLSLGSASDDPVYEDPAIQRAVNAGVTVVAASGNDGQHALSFPAANPNVIAVGASAFCDSVMNDTTTPGNFEYVASYSNFGAQLALVAPGGDPSRAQATCTQASCLDYLQWIQNLDSTRGRFSEQVGLFAGTSQAAPHVAGAVALMASKDPSLTPTLARAILTATADNIRDARQGAGRLNVLRALNATP